MAQLRERAVATDADGAFRIDDLAPGEYALVARTGDDTSAVRRALHVGGRELPRQVAVEVGAGATISEPRASIGAGTAVAGATIEARLRDARRSTSAAPRATDMPVRFTIPALAGDCVRYAISARSGSGVVHGRIEAARGARVEASAPVLP